MIKLSYEAEGEWHINESPCNGDVVIARLKDYTLVLAAQNFGVWEDVVYGCGYDHDDVVAWRYLEGFDKELDEKPEPPSSNIIDYIEVPDNIKEIKEWCEDKEKPCTVCNGLEELYFFQDTSLLCPKCRKEKD